MSDSQQRWKQRNSVVACVLATVALSAQAASFTPEPTLVNQLSVGSTVVSLAYDDVRDSLWIYKASGSTIQHYSINGELLGSLTRPGGSGNDDDLDVLSAPATLAGVDVPEGTLLFCDGDAGTTEIYALDTETGVVLATLPVAFGNSHVVGCAWHRARQTLFLLQDRVTSTEGNTIAEIDPLTGAVLNSFSVAPDLSIYYGDIEVSEANGNLFVVSSDEQVFAQLKPNGDLVGEYLLPVGVDSLSGIGLDDRDGLAWVSDIDGTLSLIDGLLAPLRYDYGDAPASFPTLRADDGARHRIGGPYLGSAPDLESDAAPSDKADGDGEDEDGVNFKPLAIGNSAAVTIKAGGPIGFVDAWIDFDGSGDFSGKEQVIDHAKHKGGKKAFLFAVPADAVEGKVIARVRISSTGSGKPKGEAVDGEVEDYRVKLVVPSLGFESDVSVTEGETATLRVVLNAPVDDDVSFDYATRESGDASAGLDFVETSGTLVIPSGDTSVKIKIQTLDDSDAEGTEAFTVKLSSVAGAVLGDGKAKVSLISDE